MTNSGRRTGSPPSSRRRRPVEQRPERRLQLDAGQRRPDAEVDAGAEGDVRVLGAADVEGVRGVEHRGVVVGRAEQRRDLLAGATVIPPISTSSVAVRSNSCSGESKRMSSSIAVGSRRAVVAQPRQLGGVRAAGRAVPLPVTLTVASWPALSSRMQVVTSSSSVSRSPSASRTLHQVADQVVAGVLPALGGQPAQVGDELVGGALGGVLDRRASGRTRTSSRSRSTRAAAAGGRPRARPAARR